MTQPQQFQQGMTISLLLLVLLVLTTTNCCYFAFAAPPQDTIDYTCDIFKDFGISNKCTTTQNGVCDNPNHGGSGGDDCLNQDCIDCISHCKEQKKESN